MGSNATNHEILGIPANASEDTIIKAYGRLALSYHPARPSNDPAAAEKLQVANRAFRELSDPISTQTSACVVCKEHDTDLELSCGCVLCVDCAEDVFEKATEPAQCPGHHEIVPWEALEKGMPRYIVEAYRRAFTKDQEEGNFVTVESGPKEHAEEPQTAPDQPQPVKDQSNQSTPSQTGVNARSVSVSDATAAVSVPNQPSDENALQLNSPIHSNGSTSASNQQEPNNALVSDGPAASSDQPHKRRANLVQGLSEDKGPLRIDPPAQKPDKSEPASPSDQAPASQSPPQFTASDRSNNKEITPVEKPATDREQARKARNPAPPQHQSPRSRSAPDQPPSRLSKSEHTTATANPPKHQKRRKSDHADLAPDVDSVTLRERIRFLEGKVTAAQTESKVCRQTSERLMDELEQKRGLDDKVQALQQKLNENEQARATMEIEGTTLGQEKADAESRAHKAEAKNKELEQTLHDQKSSAQVAGKKYADLPSQGDAGVQEQDAETQTTAIDAFDLQQQLATEKETTKKLLVKIEGQQDHIEKFKIEAEKQKCIDRMGRKQEASQELPKRAIEEKGDDTPSFLHAFSRLRAEKVDSDDEFRDSNRELERLGFLSPRKPRHTIEDDDIEEGHKEATKPLNQQRAELGQVLRDVRSKVLTSDQQEEYNNQIKELHKQIEEQETTIADLHARDEAFGKLLADHEANVQSSQQSLVIETAKSELATKYAGKQMERNIELQKSLDMVPGMIKDALEGLVVPDHNVQKLRNEVAAKDMRRRVHFEDEIEPEKEELDLKRSLVVERRYRLAWETWGKEMQHQVKRLSTKRENNTYADGPSDEEDQASSDKTDRRVEKLEAENARLRADLEECREARISDVLYTDSQSQTDESINFGRKGNVHIEGPLGRLYTERIQALQFQHDEQITAFAQERDELKQRLDAALQRAPGIQLTPDEKIQNLRAMINALNYDHAQLEAQIQTETQECAKGDGIEDARLRAFFHRERAKVKTLQLMADDLDMQIQRLEEVVDLARDHYTTAEGQAEEVLEEVKNLWPDVRSATAREELERLIALATNGKENPDVTGGGSESDLPEQGSDDGSHEVEVEIDSDVSSASSDTEPDSKVQCGAEQGSSGNCCCRLKSQLEAYRNVLQEIMLHLVDYYNARLILSRENYETKLKAFRPIFDRLQLISMKFHDDLLLARQNGAQSTSHEQDYCECDCKGNDHNVVDQGTLRKALETASKNIKDLQAENTQLKSRNERLRNSIHQDPDETDGIPALEDKIREQQQTIHMMRTSIDQQCTRKDTGAAAKAAIIRVKKIGTLEAKLAEQTKLAREKTEEVKKMQEAIYGMLQGYTAPPRPVTPKAPSIAESEREYIWRDKFLCVATLLDEMADGEPNRPRNREIRQEWRRELFEKTYAEEEAHLRSEADRHMPPETVNQDRWKSALDWMFTQRRTFAGEGYLRLEQLYARFDEFETWVTSGGGKEQTEPWSPIVLDDSTTGAITPPTDAVTPSADALRPPVVTITPPSGAKEGGLDVFASQDSEL